jgi:hypothetical protein
MGLLPQYICGRAKTMCAVGVLLVLLKSLQERVKNRVKKDFTLISNPLQLAGILFSAFFIPKKNYK